MADKTPNELMVILDEQNVPADNAKELIAAFGAPFIEAGEILSTYKDIVVTDESQTDLMLEAKTKRLALKNIRTGVEKRRVELKEASLKTGRAIDSVAKYVKDTIQPAEEYLELQEKFIDLAKAKRAAEVKADRVEKLSKYMTDPAGYYRLDDMTDEQFEDALASAKSVYDAKQAELKRIEDERIKEEAAEKKRQEEVEAENVRLKKEAEAKEKADAIIRARINQVTSIGLVWHETFAVYEKDGFDVTPADIKELPDDAFNKKVADIKAKLDEKAATEKAAADKLKAEEDAKLEEERKAAEATRIEKEKLEKAESDRIVAEAKEQAEHDEADRKALLAPDKDKLRAFASRIAKIRTEDLPAVKSAAAQKTVNHIEAKLTALIEDIKEQVEKL